ncbi:15343_t:CDS:2 [Acaulospora morrowiae]|uniref:15343_t:CDS:1 n=1 Tax=Acaulospora morrowiae TaxID=94023 RepID=A0A9N9B225_9GLOM|nr:15343_t:CDS:2 [Acaulospora morrowiae]
MSSLDSTEGNRFGNGIPSRPGNPIQLLEYVSSGDESFGKIVINDAALRIINNIREPVAIIAVVGSYRRGKSWFANVLHGRHDGFELGSKVEGCTRGIYMWDTPFSHEGKRVIVLDCEGIDDPKQEQAWAVKLFILCLIVSSTFIYNISGIVGRDDIGKLYLMTDLTKFIQPPSGYDFLPRLVVLLRDFQLDEPDDFRKYFIEKLNNVNEEIAKSIKNYFHDFNVFGLPHPGCNRSQLRDMENVATENLDEEFVNIVVTVVRSIYSNLNPKYIGSSTMTGMSFGKFLVDCVEKMNDPENSEQLSIPSEYETVIQYMSHKATDKCMEIYESGMNEEIKDRVPILWDEFDDIHNNYYNKAQEEFHDMVIGSSQQVIDFIDGFNAQIQKVKEKYVKTNSEALYAYNHELAENLWKTHIKCRLNKENLFKDKDEFDAAEEAFRNDYQNQMMASPEAGAAITKFLDDNYSQALEILTQLGTLKEEQANALRRLEEAQKESIKAQERVTSLESAIKQGALEGKQQAEKLERKMNDMAKNIENQKTQNEELKKQLLDQQRQMVEQQKAAAAEREKRMQQMMEREREAAAERERLMQRMLEQESAARREALLLSQRGGNDDGGCQIL